MCLNAGAMGRQDAESETLIPVNRCGFDVAHALRAEGFDASEDGTGRGTPLVPICFDTTQITSVTNRSNPRPGDPCHTLTKGSHAPAIAFSFKDSGNDATSGVSPTLRSLGAYDANGSSQMVVAIRERAVSENPSAGPQGAGFNADGAAYTLEARNKVQAVAFDLRGREGGAQFEGPHDTANIRAASGGSSRSYVAQTWAVRRLTPVECERLQGFPDGYTDVPYRGKPAADGPRYKALGNSMARNVMRRIGRRIEYVERLIAAEGSK
jgi:DNA (cytosine-5)-methyltransferase 1